MPNQTTQTQTGVDVYYLPFGDNDDEERHAALTELRHRISYDDHLPTQAEFEEHYTHEGHDPEANLSNVFAKWNAGSRQESEAFARRECQDCDASFIGDTGWMDDYERINGHPPENPVNLRQRQVQAEAHEEDTGHTVGHGHRSMSVGDIVVHDGTPYLVARIDCEELPHIEVDL